MRLFVIGPEDDPDKYRLRRRMGGGGEAELWEAEVDLSGGRERVAVKILRDRHIGDARDWQRRWAEQADLLRLVSHPGVVGVHGYFEGPRMHPPGQADARDRAHYLVMNWIDGQDMREWVPQHSGPEQRFTALRVLGQIADVLDWLHSGRATPSGRAVVHGDLSPANVIINRDGQAVIVDFGLFRMVGAVTELPAGTRGYCAPEVFARGEYSPATDRYSFGALAYYMLAGTHPQPDPRALREAMAQIITRAGHPAEAAEQMAEIVADEPAQRPAAGEWVRMMMLHSSTAAPRSGPLPPPAPGSTSPTGPETGGTRPATRRRQTIRRVKRTLLVGAFAALTLATAVLATALMVATDDEGAGDDSSGAPRAADQGGSGPGRVPPSSGSPPATAPAAGRLSLAFEEPVTGEQFERGAMTVKGHSYPTTMHSEMSPDSGTANDKSEEFNLVGRYQQFHAMVGLADTSETGSSITFIVRVDGRQVATATVTVFQVKPLDAVVSGGNRLTITVRYNGNKGLSQEPPPLAKPVIIDPYLVPAK